VLCKTLVQSSWKEETLKLFHPRQTPYSSTQRGLCARLGTAGARPWCHPTHCHIQVCVAGSGVPIKYGRRYGLPFDPRRLRAARNCWSVDARVPQGLQRKMYMCPSRAAMHSFVQLWWFLREVVALPGPAAYHNSPFSRSQIPLYLLPTEAFVHAGLASSQCKLFTNTNKNTKKCWRETIETFLNCTDCFLNRG